MAAAASDSGPASNASTTGDPDRRGNVPGGPRERAGGRDDVGGAQRGALPDPRRRRVVRAGSRGPARLARAGGARSSRTRRTRRTRKRKRIGGSNRTNRSGPAPGLLADGADDEVDDRGVEDGDREFEEVLAEAEREEETLAGSGSPEPSTRGRRRTRRRRRSRCRWPDCWRSTRCCAATACRGRCGRGSRGRRPRPSSGSRRTRAGSRRRRWPRAERGVEGGRDPVDPGAARVDQTSASTRKFARKATLTTTCVARRPYSSA